MINDRMVLLKMPPVSYLGLKYLCLLTASLAAQGVDSFSSATSIITPKCIYMSPNHFFGKER